VRPKIHNVKLGLNFLRADREDPEFIIGEEKADQDGRWGVFFKMATNSHNPFKVNNTNAGIRYLFTGIF
jgi:hypothetical protein